MDWMAWITQGIDMVLHVDAHLDQLVAMLGSWIYLILFLVVFCETGLVVTPFLPGDSLLFAAGAVFARYSGELDVFLLGFLLILAGVLGDAVNYAVGKIFGPKIFQHHDGFFLKRSHLVQAQNFYERHGGKAIVIARFMPIVRTFAPFVAGMGQMNYRRFAAYNVFGACVWVVGFLTAGYFFGNLPIVRKNFTLVIYGVIVLSLLPALVPYLQRLRTPVSEGG